MGTHRIEIDVLQDRDVTIVKAVMDDYRIDRREAYGSAKRKKGDKVHSEFGVALALSRALHNLGIIELTEYL